MISVNGVSRHFARMNYKPLTWGFNVSEVRHATYVHDRHRPDRGVSLWSRCAMSGRDRAMGPRIW
jgi:hypothetical protein